MFIPLCVGAGCHGCFLRGFDRSYRAEFEREPVSRGHSEYNVLNSLTRSHQCRPMIAVKKDNGRGLLVEPGIRIVVVTWSCLMSYNSAELVLEITDRK